MTDTEGVQDECGVVEVAFKDCHHGSLAGQASRLWIGFDALCLVDADRERLCPWSY